jgi:hypothetical protein
MTKKLVWRLADRPTVNEIILLVEKKLLKEDEAKEILFNSVNEEDRDKKSLESEIKFLRDLILQMNRTGVNVVESIKVVERPIYYKQPWFEPAITYLCSNGTSGIVENGTTNLTN